MKIKSCLFDMDGTIADHTGALMRDLAKIQSPEDLPIRRYDEDEPEWAKARKKLIRSQRNWWFDLDKIPFGFDIYHAARSIGFQINILTKGPWTSPHAWTEKVQWVRKHLDDDVKITISEDKSIVYGRILVDDYVPYVLGWLEYRPRGLAVMVANDDNENLPVKVRKYCAGRVNGKDLLEVYDKAKEENRIVRYDGTNFDDVVSRMQWAFDRK